MRAVRRALARMRTLLRGHGRADDDLRAEMEAHLEMEIEENLRRGMTPGEARRRAMLASGGLLQAAERVREERGLPWIENAVADSRHALRQYRRAPLVTFTTILVLSLGIGTTVVLFTIMSSLATLPPPGIARDEALVRIRGTLQRPNMAGVEPRLLPWPEVERYVERSELFEGVAAHADETAVVTLPGPGDGVSTPTVVRVVYVSPAYFRLLGVHPALGSEPPADPDVSRLTTSPAAVVSHALWTRQLGGTRDAIGRVVRVNGMPVEIAGVAPPRFLGTGGQRVGGALTMWVPLAAYPVLQERSPDVFGAPDGVRLSAFARLRPGVTPQAATAVVASIAARAFEGRQDETGSADVVPLLASNPRVANRTDRLVSQVTAFGLALLVLLITCTNVSALRVGLAGARRREIGVRLSLGAPRARLIRQLLTESVVLALAAAAVCLVVTAAGVQSFGALFEDVQLVVDWRVAIATFAVALLTGISFGLSPALHATRVSVGQVLASSSSSVPGRRSRLQPALVVLQIALTQPLLVGLAVVVVTLGADVSGGATSRAPDRIAEIELDTWGGRVSMDEREDRIAAVVERIAQMPGVRAAMPMEMGTVTAPLAVHPQDRIAGVTPESVLETHLTAAPAGYFEAMEIPIVLGRDFAPGERTRESEAADAASLAPSFDAVIVGSDLARRLWRDASPIGRRFTMPLADGSRADPMVVVGVVDAAAAGPSTVVGADGPVRVYVPYATMNTGVIARTAGPAAPLLNAMREAVAREAPEMPIVRAQTVEQRETGQRRDLRRTAGAVAGGGLLALLLSAIGLYAVVSFAVGQRTREIGVRTTLGAQRGQVVRLFFLEGLGLSALGLALGLPLSMLATRWIAATLHWPLASPPLLGAAIGTLVLAVASAAVWIPARRASRMDPLEALRSD